MAFESGVVRGNVAADPELRYTTDGRAVLNIRVVENPRVFDQESGQWKDGKAIAHRVAVWGEAAENAAATLVTGTPVVVSGRVKIDAFTDREGNSAYSTQITADFVAVDLRWTTAEVTRVKATHEPAALTTTPVPAHRSIPGADAEWPAVAPAALAADPLEGAPTVITLRWGRRGFLEFGTLREDSDESGRT